METFANFIFRGISSIFCVFGIYGVFSADTMLGLVKSLLAVALCLFYFFIDYKLNYKN